MSGLSHGYMGRPRELLLGKFGSDLVDQIIKAVFILHQTLLTEIPPDIGTCVFTFSGAKRTPRAAPTATPPTTAINTLRLLIIVSFVFIS